MVQQDKSELDRKRNRPAIACRPRRTDVITTRDPCGYFYVSKDSPFQQQCGRIGAKSAREKENRMYRILRTPEVVRLTGLSKTTLWRRVRSGDFPVPLKLGSLGTRSIGWREDDVERWLDSRPTIDD